MHPRGRAVEGTPGSSSSSRSLGSSGRGGQSRKGEVALDTGLGGDRRLDLWVQMSVSLFTVSHHPYPGLVST